MNLLITASHADYERMPQMAELLKKQGPYPGHGIVLLHTQDVPAQEAETFIDSVRSLFNSAKVVAITALARSWPAGSAQCFIEVCRWAAMNATGPCYNFELDNVPMKKGWLDTLEREYHGAGQPFMGCVVKTRGFVDGQPVSTGERHMVGTGIYPHDFAKRSVKLNSVARIMAWVKTPLEPYDIQLRHEIVPQAHHTNKIAHRFKTVNYRIEGGQLVCDNQPGNPEAASHAAPVGADVCVVHGCKDDSLAKLVLAGTAVPELTTKPAPEPELPTAPAAKPNAAPANFLVFRIKEKLKDGKGRRVKAFAEELEISEDQLREAIAAPNSGLEIINPGYVRPKAKVDVPTSEPQTVVV